MEDESSASLLNQIQLLSNLHVRLQSLRYIPRVLLRPPPLSAVVSTSPPSLRPQFQQLEDIAQVTRSHPIQLALRSANDSLMKDLSDLAPCSRRENYSHIHVPDSPQPYLPPEQKKATHFPPYISTHESLTADELIDYIRGFNEKHQCKLHIWTPSKSHNQEALEPPITLRFSIPNVLCAFLSLNICQSSRSVVVESISIFGPREKKTAQLQSDFTVYQCLSQQMSKMLQLQAQLPPQSIVDMLESYEGLFIDKCTVCERVLSAEGHIPPVVRVWTEGGWQPRHIMCQQGS